MLLKMMLKKLCIINWLNNIDTSDFVLKTEYQADKKELERKRKQNSSLATKTALTAVENKIPHVSCLVKKNK